MILIFIAIGAFAATFLGGLFALRFRDTLHLVLGFSARRGDWWAFFDLSAGGAELAAPFSASTVTTAVAIGFVLYMLLDRSIVPHVHVEDDHCANEEHAPAAKVARGWLGGRSLSFHSFLDVTHRPRFPSVPAAGLVAIASRPRFLRWY